MCPWMRPSWPRCRFASRNEAMKRRIMYLGGFFHGLKVQDPQSQDSPRLPWKDDQWLEVLLGVSQLGRWSIPQRLHRVKSLSLGHGRGLSSGKSLSLAKDQHTLYGMMIRNESMFTSLRDGNRPHRIVLFYCHCSLLLPSLRDKNPCAAATVWTMLFSHLRDRS